VDYLVRAINVGASVGLVDNLNLVSECSRRLIVILNSACCRHASTIFHASQVTTTYGSTFINHTHVQTDLYFEELNDDTLMRDSAEWHDAPVSRDFVIYQRC